VSPVKYKLGFYIPEDGVLHSLLETLCGTTTANLLKILTRVYDHTFSRMICQTVVLVTPF
jgi:hypothetical protein